MQWYITLCSQISIYLWNSHYSLCHKSVTSETFLLHLFITFECVSAFVLNISFSEALCLDHNANQKYVISKIVSYKIPTPLSNCHYKMEAFWVLCLFQMLRSHLFAFNNGKIWWWTVDLFHSSEMLMKLWTNWICIALLSYSACSSFQKKLMVFIIFTRLKNIVCFHIN